MLVSYSTTHSYFAPTHRGLRTMKNSCAVNYWQSIFYVRMGIPYIVVYYTVPVHRYMYSVHMSATALFAIHKGREPPNGQMDG